MSSDSWGSDVPISMPSPPSYKTPGVQDLGEGFVMTAGGIFPALNSDEFEEYVTPTFSPATPSLESETSS